MVGGEDLSMEIISSSIKLQRPAFAPFRQRGKTGITKGYFRQKGHDCWNEQKYSPYISDWREFLGKETLGLFGRAWVLMCNLAYIKSHILCYVLEHT